MRYIKGIGVAISFLIGCATLICVAIIAAAWILVHPRTEEVARVAGGANGLEVIVVQTSHGAGDSTDYVVFVAESNRGISERIAVAELRDASVDNQPIGYRGGPIVTWKDSETLEIGYDRAEEAIELKPSCTFGGRNISIRLQPIKK